MQKLEPEKESRPDWKWLRSIAETGQDVGGRIMVSGEGDLPELNLVLGRIHCRAKNALL